MQSLDQTNVRTKQTTVVGQVQEMLDVALKNLNQNQKELDLVEVDLRLQAAAHQDPVVLLAADVHQDQDTAVLAAAAIQDAVLVLVAAQDIIVLILDNLALEVGALNALAQIIVGHLIALLVDVVGVTLVGVVIAHLRELHIAEVLIRIIAQIATLQVVVQLVVIVKSNSYFDKKSSLKKGLFLCPRFFKFQQV